VDVEHGARGGDELNLIGEGKNYAGQSSLTAKNISGEPIPVPSRRKKNYQQPVYYWDPVIALRACKFTPGRLSHPARQYFFIGGLVSQNSSA
jgi:glucose/arabinose dehydrogenase